MVEIMAIRELLEQGLSREEALRIAAEYLNMTPEKAAFVLAVELGEIDGDLEPMTEQPGKQR